MPKFLYEAVKKYVVLVRPLNELRYKGSIISLDEGIFVPRKDLHSDCGGILLYEKEFPQKIDNFCDVNIGRYIPLYGGQPY